MGIRSDSDLFGLVNMDGRAVPLPPGGLLVSQKLAEILAVGVGDWVELEVLDGKKPIRQVMIAGTLQDFAGLSVYMDLDALRQLDARRTGRHRRRPAGRSKVSDRLVSRTERNAPNRGGDGQAARDRQFRQDRGRKPCAS